MELLVIGFVYFVMAADPGSSRKHRKATSLREATTTVVGIPGFKDIQFDTATIAIAIAVKGIDQIIAAIKAARRIGAWLCRNFHSFIVADFALVIRID